MTLFTGARMHATIGAISSGVPVIPVAYSRKFNGLYDTLQYPFYIDAKADITLEQAIELFEDYMNKIDEMRNAVTVAQGIYSKKLKEYQNNLAKIFELK